MEKKKITEKQMITKLKKMGFIKNNAFKVRVNSSNKSIKAGDFVITFEIHKVVERFKYDKVKFSCVDVLPIGTYPDKKGFGQHQYIKHSGTGQQGITKLLKV